MTNEPSAVPPGWYPEPGGDLRYWDGTEWTEHRAPAPKLADPTATAGIAAPLQSETPSLLEPTSDERTMATLAHALSIVASILAPLVIWALKKDESPFVRAHAAEALNFSISVVIYGFAYVVLALPLIFVGIGILMLLLLPVFAIVVFVLHIVAAMAANRGELYKYPFSIRLIS